MTLHQSVNILYLENHAIFAEQVTRQFLRAHRVTVVPSLAAARSALADGRFDLILSDYDLDDGKGEQFVRECRATHPDLPVIAVSSHEAGNAALVAAGASAVCGKLEFDRIHQVIEGLEQWPHIAHTGKSRITPAKHEEMIREYPIADRVPGWYFRMREKTPSVWDVEGRDIYGREVSRLSVIDEDRALQECIEYARKIQEFE